MNIHSVESLFSLFASPYELVINTINSVIYDIP